MRFFLLAIFFIIFFIILLSPQPVNAANVWICGTVGGVEACTNYNTDTGACDRSPGFVSDFSSCQIIMGSSYQNTCCRQSGGCIASGDQSSLNQWDYNYASGCIVEFGGGFCTATWRYQTQTCGATDTCYSGAPTLNPGLCSDTGCSVSSAPYKTCCYADTGLLDGSCTGGQYSGSCPGGTATVMCGVSQSTCDAVAPYRCSTASCGSPACADEFPQATPPPPTPTPTPAPTPSTEPGCPGMTCSYSELNSVCPTGIQIVTGTGCDGVNCGGCTYVGGCSAINCEPTGGCNWNGVQDNGETGIDCGGGGCPDCSGGGGGGGGSGIADFDVRLSVRNITQGGSYTYGPLSANPGDLLTYQFLTQNWSDRTICWFNVYDNFFSAYGTPYSKWQAIMDGVGITCYDSSICWVDWRYDPDFTAPGPAPNSPNMLAPWDSSGRGLNYTGIDVCGEGQMDYTESWVAYFDVQVKDSASLGSVSSFIERAYVYYNGDIDQGNPPEPYNSCVDSGGNPEGGAGPSWTIVPCSWWFPSNDVVVNILPPAEPCNNSTPPNNRMYACYFEPGTTCCTLPPQPADSGGSALAQGLEPSGNLPSGTSLVGTATAVDQNWVGGEVDGTNKWDDVTAIWKGRINFQAGTYTFYVGTDDGNTLTIKDGPEGTINLSSNWTYGAYYDPEASTSYTFSTAGWRTVIFKYFEGPGAAAARLRWVFTPPPTPAPAWIQVTGDVHSNTRINAPGGP